MLSYRLCWCDSRTGDLRWLFTLNLYQPIDEERAVVLSIFGLNCRLCLLNYVQPIDSRKYTCSIIYWSSGLILFFSFKFVKICIAYLVILYFYLRIFYIEHRRYFWSLVYSTRQFIGINCASKQSAALRQRTTKSHYLSNNPNIYIYIYRVCLYG